MTRQYWSREVRQLTVLLNLLLYMVFENILKNLIGQEISGPQTFCETVTKRNYVNKSVSKLIVYMHTCVYFKSLLQLGQYKSNWFESNPHFVVIICPCVLYNQFKLSCTIVLIFECPFR